MSRNKHSYVRFFFDDWQGGISGLPRLVWSVYFQVCLFNWDKGQPMPKAHATLAFADLPNHQGDAIIEMLVESGKLARDERGLFSQRALDEAAYSFDQWERRSRGGKGGAEKRQSKKESLKDSSKSHQGLNGSNSQPNPEPESGDESPDARGFAPSPQGVVDAWNAMAKQHRLPAVKLLTEERKNRLEARIAEHGAATIIAAILDEVPQSDFLLGGGRNGWKANFDWLLRPERCAKLVEEGYRQGSGGDSGWRE